MCGKEGVHTRDVYSRSLDCLSCRYSVCSEVRDYEGIALVVIRVLDESRYRCFRFRLLYIRADIQLVHNNLGDEKQYNSEESLTSKHNTSVRKFLEDEVNSQEKGYQRKSVKRAAAHYYETKRRLYLASLPANADKAAKDQQSNKLRSRRQRVKFRTLRITKRGKQC
ncbi:predicted protein [Nematostella vectensis]|uniref:Uncharacterized protein n=1 Tax=Nematostella vectensis TaxID=45351 RepID=A7RQR9_NEMVE|nr:predicted protein [Nematostella vectensis]|eukprot:XP_001638216.1 predicted protein [Nematostella vectensis]